MKCCSSRPPNLLSNFSLAYRYCFDDFVPPAGTLAICNELEAKALLCSRHNGELSQLTARYVLRDKLNVIVYT